MTTYQEVEQWMFEKLKRYQSVGASAFKPGLERILAFSKELDNPHTKFKSIHVGGTNGKGSTSHMLASILQEAGYKVGLYTSPHLKSFTERIRLNGQEVEEQFVIDFANQNRRFVEENKLSFFELTVGMAFDYFSRSKVDVAIIEVGMGGRLDATNIIKPEISVITNIGYDHMNVLGNTLEKIAGEKAGIIKSGIPVVIGERQDETTSVFMEKATQVDAEIFFASDDSLNYATDLLGKYQSKNANTAVYTILKLNGFKITEDQIQAGLNKVQFNTNLKGRWQILAKEPLTVCDTGHNRDGLVEVTEQIKKQNIDSIYMILGFVNDKDLESILDLFPKNAKYLFCKPNIQRGLDPYILQQKAKDYDLIGEVYDSVSEAYQTAIEKAKNTDMIFIGGSTFVVAEVI